MDIEKELQKELLSNMESGRMRASYDREIEFYDTVASGNEEALENFLGRNADPGRYGVLSHDDIVNRRYHAVVMTALISRFCVESGMDIELSYTMSDLFIRRIDSARTAEEISAISSDIARSYCRKMKELTRNGVRSRHVILAIDYIKARINENITVDKISGHLSLDPSYLSKLFKSETGVTVSRYVRDEKIRVACRMLRHLDESSLNIANYLGFSSQSHFIQVFKKETGQTPEEYRKSNYHSSWMGEE